MSMVRSIPPQLPPPDGMTADEEKASLKTVFPHMIKGKRREITPEISEMYRYALSARNYWQDQLVLITNQIRRELGDAQIATVQGTPFAERRMYDRQAYDVPEGKVDAIYPRS